MGCATSRMGSTLNVQSFKVRFNETTATKKLTLQASALKPVLVRITLAAIVGISGASPEISLGTTSTATEWLNAVTTLPLAGVGVMQATPYVITSNKDVYVKIGGVATAGELFVVLETMELNTQAA